MNLDYKQLFQEATRFDPFPYQEILATTEKLPELLKVPTGAGKTASVIISWVWRRRFAEQSVRVQTPRRLIYCLPMRVLVEQTYENAISWLDRLGLLAGSAAWEKPEEKTGLIKYLPEHGQPANEKISVHLLMGGEDAGKWEEYPERDAILIGTQDMLISRELNRGYASSRFRWPLEFGLLNNDCLWVMDEVQLMGAGLPTSAQIEAFRGGFGTFGNHHTIWMSATCEEDWIKTVDFKKPELDQVKISEEDTKVEKLQKRLTAFKKLENASITLKSTKKEDSSKEYIDKLSKLIQDQYQRAEPAPSMIIIVNTVNRAQDLYQKLTKEYQNKSGTDKPQLFLLHGRFRLPEKTQIFNNFKSTDNKNIGKILISTQVIEAGVDVSAHILITELAPWSSLVQRFGRLNRYGEYNDSIALWIDIDTKKDSQSTALPYSALELNTARSILEGLKEVSPQTLDDITQPPIDVHKHVIRRKDLGDLFDTTADLTGNDIDISRFIRDSEDRDVLVYWREWEGNKPPEDHKGPLKEELCQVPIADFKDFLKNKREQTWLWDYLEGKWINPNFNNIHPGQTFLISPEAGGYGLKIGWSKDCKDRVPQLFSETPANSNDSTDKDPGVASQEWETIAKHAGNILKQMEKLLSNLEPIAWEYANILENAAYYHDIGKAHEVFQEAILSGFDESKGDMRGELWAKSNQQSGIRYKRKHFRHELASALLLLQNGDLIKNIKPDDVNLLAYLVAAHHGKVRLSIRSVPGEMAPDNLETTRFARGIWEGDTIPEIYLGNNVKIPPTTLSLSLMEIGADKYGNPSWLERMCELRDNLGPFRLAYLEGLVRIADWRASSLQEESDE